MNQPSPTGSSHLAEEAAELHRMVKPLLDGTMIPRMPYWWCPAEELTLWSVSRFLLTHLLVWGGFAMLAAWLVTPWAGVFFAGLFAIEIAQLTVRRKLPVGSLLEALHGTGIGIIYAVVVTLVAGLAGVFIFDAIVPIVWWRGICLGIVAATTYVGLNAGQGMRQHIRRGRTSYAGAALQVIHASAPCLVVACLTLGFREQLGSGWLWGMIFAIGFAVGALQEGFGECRNHMQPRELGKVFLTEFAKSAIVVGIANLVLFSLSRLPAPSELLILWLAPTIILFDARTAKFSEMEYAEWQSKAYSFGIPLKGLGTFGGHVGHNASLLVHSLSSYPRHFLRALTWEARELAPTSVSG